MGFDGVGYSQFELCQPSMYHSNGPLVGAALGRPLRTAYCFGRHHGRVMIDQHYPLPLRTPTSYQDTAHVYSGSFVRIAEAYRLLHTEATHLVGEAHFAAPAVPDTGVAFHRLVVTDGTNTDTGDTVETVIAPQMFAANAPLPGALHVLSATSFGAFSLLEWSGRQVARFEVELDAVATGAARLIYVEAYAKTFLATPETPYVPLHIAVWTEVREP